MKIAVVGATGMIGSCVVTEAASRGHQVTGISRSGKPAVAQTNVTTKNLDITDSTAAEAIARNHDVVVSAIGPSRQPGGHPEAFASTLEQLARDVREARLVVVGGAGSLLAAPGLRLVDTPGFPEIHKIEALAAAEGLYRLQNLDDIGEWTYLSPAPMIEPGVRTGSYNIGDDAPAGDRVSVEDFAVALLDEIETPAHTGQRFTVAN